MKKTFNKTLNWILFASVWVVLLFPTSVFAADEGLEDKANTFITDVIQLMLNIFAGVVTLAFIFHAFKGAIATNAHKKAESHEGMLTTIKVFVLALCAKAIIAWVASKLS